MSRNSGHRFSNKGMRKTENRERIVLAWKEKPAHPAAGVAER
jgi:hypothetical protein